MATEYYQANISAICAGQRCEIVTHWRTIDPTETDDYQLALELAGEIANDGLPNSLAQRIASAMSDECFLSAIRTKRVAPTGGNTSVIVFTPTTFPGVLAEEMSPQQNSACIIWGSETEPMDTGRNFIFGVGEASISQGTFTDAYKTLIDNLITKWIPGFSSAGGTWEPVIYDRVAKTGRLIANGYLSPMVGVQRRRELPV